MAVKANQEQDVASEQTREADSVDQKPLLGAVACYRHSAKIGQENSVQIHSGDGIRARDLRVMGARRDL